MSGVAGIFYLDRKPTHSEECGKMLDRIQHRGGDGRGVWVGTHVALGHVHHHSTKESLREKQPQLSSNGSVVLVSDCRIDNRDELVTLLATLGANPLSTDVELLACAYEKWGDGFPKHVVGAFAAVLWDEAQQKLLLVRDHMGLRPLYYSYEPNQYLVFASEIKALHALPFVNREPDRLRIADYIIWLEEDAQRTFYKDVKSVRPSELVRVGLDGLACKTYWALNPDDELRLNSDEAYAEAFEHILIKAVASRCGSEYPLGSMLSGGLDSSSITALARQIMPSEEDIYTFSFIFDQLPECDERRFIKEIWGSGAYNKVLVEGDQLGTFDDLDQVLWHVDEPHIAVNMFLHWDAWKRAKEHGVRTVLDGFFGDSAVSFGYEIITELIKKGRFVQAAKTLNRITSFEYPGERRVKLQVAVGSLDALLPHTVKARMGRLGFPDERCEWMSRVELLNKDFRDEVRPFERLKDLNVFPRRRFKSVRHEHFDDVTSGAYANAFASMNKAAAAFGVDVALPFADKRVVEFCLSLPARQRILNGRSRSILRRAMRDVLPSSIRDRNDKANLGPNYERAFREIGHVTTREIFTDPREILSEFYDLPTLKSQIFSGDGKLLSSAAHQSWFPTLLYKWFA